MDALGQIVCLAEPMSPFKNFNKLVNAILLNKSTKQLQNFWHIYCYCIVHYLQVYVAIFMYQSISHTFYLSPRHFTVSLLKCNSQSF